MRLHHPQEEYYLEVVKPPEKPQFPKDEGVLEIGHQTLGDGYVQYWAYPENLGKDLSELPEAEIIASEQTVDEPVILVDQLARGQEGLIELILVKDGHAWIKTSTSIENLEDNLGDVIDLARSKYQFSVEHFLTTRRVSEEANQQLDRIAGDGKEPDILREGSEQSDGREIKSVKPANPEVVPGYPHTFNQNQETLPNQGSQNPLLSKLSLIIPIVILIGLLIGSFIYKDKILARIQRISNVASKEAEVTLTPTMTPTPTEEPIKKEDYQVRVLNGTTKTGLAGDLAKKLEEAGWKIQSKGNAKNQTLPQTQIKAKEDMEKVIEAFIEDLGSDYEATVAGKLISSDKADLEVTIGKK